ncbi:oxygen-independent coproporphyrinogen III oxidase [Ancylobacter sp. 6x-1]|uniref:Coproporphyrinogen-III oxidase n=1 Tax=Ancylobacter crimeensis TaxID=2579147 RepID=A0ABT0DFN0_9HYPH|nr:oxygen-independent coproporphyrinogen III oxidase [Ancylobacter crimeensis]MCK0198781.1 oxygen-independent coproporphyrinogen III oxidase [Ancylobacter crimeensis]
MTDTAPLDERLPRYTSYPTAPVFGEAVGAGLYGAWLDMLAPGTPTSLYVHVPFCRSMCWYCGCNTTVALRDRPVLDYLAALRAEIDLVAARCGRAADVRHIHFGGGTPTILAADDFRALMDLLRARFAVHPGAEIAVEIDPRRLDAAMIAALAASGVNRASLGVQSFDGAVQAAINRIQSVGQTAAVVDGLRAAGIGAINLDLIYGLPKQTLASCRETVEACLAFHPDRFSVFGYAHLPGFKKHQSRIDAADLPGGRERLAQAVAFAQAILGAGYVRIGLDHFARPDDPMATAMREGGLRRNFQGYTTDSCQALVGLGASSIGRLPQGYVQNETVLRAYAERVRRGELPVAKGHAFSADDRLRAELIERVMCDLAVDIETVCARHGVARGALAPVFPALEALRGAGVIAFDGRRLRVLEAGRLRVRKVASIFDAYLDGGARRFSRAV